MGLKFPLSPYTMLRTHNIAWRKLHPLFFNIIKRGKGRQSLNCINSSFSHNLCRWLSQKFAEFEVRYFKVALFESNWRHAFTHYVTTIKPLINIGSRTSSLITWDTEAKFFRSKFCKFFLLIEIWGRLNQFSVTNLLSIYDYILDNWVNSWNF